jgi:DMSO/TMAO reductase YedYZ molybdopterin-dependent catalytic subunit
MISRRHFLTAVSAALAAGATFHPYLSWALDEFSGHEGMIVRSDRFLDLEAPPEFLNQWITPVPHFFVRNHMHEPSTLDASDWQLTISGQVQRPLKLNLKDLSKLHAHEVINTLECAGNGRGLHRPQVPGIQWEKGAVGNARFAGPRLKDILDRAGVKTAGKHVMFHGLDDVPGRVPPFIRSIPMNKAMDPDTLLATHMNGAPLTRNHGFPARSLVPGWIGSASVKWLSQIQVLDKEFEGNFMKPGYRLPNHPVKPGEAVNPDDTHPVTSLTVKSLIATPTGGKVSNSRTLQIQGVAWAGETQIAKVEVSTDSGSTWQPAQLGREQAKYAWRLWHYKWKAPKSGDYTIMSRATDTQGRTQPQVAEWNPSGYLYNAVDQVKINVQT